MGDLAGAENHPLAQQYPCRLPVWWGRHGEVEKDPMKSGVSGRLVVLRIPKQFRRFEGVLARLLKAPKEIRRPLDRMNSMLWELCDGSRTFVEICSVLDEVFKEEIAPVLHHHCCYSPSATKQPPLDARGTSEQQVACRAWYHARASNT